MGQTVNTNKLFVASCLALVVTSMTFAIRAGMLGQLGIDFGLNTEELGWIAGTAFWGFPLAVIIGGALVDIIGMRKLMYAAFFSHVVGIVMTITAGGFWSLFFSTLLIGIANGLVEAVCNPLIASMYPDDKTTKLNHFHIWFPGGLVIGGLVAYFLGGAGIGWQIQMATMLIPAAIYGVMFLGEKFPVTERVAQGVSTGEMYKSLLNPLFIFMVICMLGTAVTELGTNQWIGVLLANVTDNALLLLVFISGIMAIGRGMAGPVVHKMSPAGVLLVSSILASIGLYLLSTLSGNMLFVAAGIFALGVTYFWPTMLGFVAEYTPKTGAIGLSLMGGAGMFANSIFFPIMGRMYDSNLSSHLPKGAELATYQTADAGTEMANQFAQAQVLAGPEILQAMVWIPVLLTFAFGALYFYTRNKTKAEIIG
ncbi:MAG: sugar MFS transporter [Chitinophagales bacterium]